MMIWEAWVPPLCQGIQTENEPQISMANLLLIRIKQLSYHITLVGRSPPAAKA